MTEEDRRKNLTLRRQFNFLRIALLISLALNVVLFLIIRSLT